ncbi:hypothetical protein ACX1DX_07980 [Tessaracoccus sp. Y36]
MALKRNVVIAAIAAAALGVSACSGTAETPQTQAPASSTATAQETGAGGSKSTAVETSAEATPTQEDSPAAEPSEEESPPEEASGELPWDEGPVDTEAFLDLYRPVQESITTMKMTTSTSVPGSETVTYVDSTDPTNPRTYTVLEAAGKKVESVTEGTTAYTRTDGGAWQEQQIPDSAEGTKPTLDAETLRGLVESIELVDKDERKFTVVLDLGALVPSAAPGTEGIPTTWWLDDQLRLVKQEMTIMEATVITEYSEFNQPVDIPQVP